MTSGLTRFVSALVEFLSQRKILLTSSGGVLILWPSPPERKVEAVHCPSSVPREIAAGAGGWWV
ncbi:MAG TPA: hypothetical protein VFR51_09660, partial [Pyrinomonadaceae bacterium]|nr:hypothetical protein [Pyrinomonadaceae bacterium]